MAVVPEKKHAKLSASGAERWMACPGSIRLSEGIPRTSSKAADEGTTAHWVLEKLLKAKYPRTAARKLEAKYGGEMVGHARRAQDEILSRMSRESELLVEVSVDQGLELLHPHLGGTLDAALVDEFVRLTIIDYKYGRSRVNPQENFQLMTYAVGLLQKYNWNFIEVALVIIQPRCGPVCEWVTDIDTLRDFGKSLVSGAYATELPGAVLEAGRHCYFCPAREICPETQKKNLEKAKKVFADAEK